ncbi:hypothetical protein L1049_025283 [Liquidambar formosana]|uniref:Uncharacterized protein n=1 Tax=Liquidambar formosana TaxID=63359 RepID=A0AAP0N4K3_LIQFO
MKGKAKSCFCVALLVVILLIPLCRAKTSPTSSDTRRCDGSIHECDSNSEFLLDTEINMRLLAGTAHPVTPDTTNPNKSPANCGQANISLANIDTPRRNGPIHECDDLDLEFLVDTEINKRLLQNCESGPVTAGTTNRNKQNPACCGQGHHDRSLPPLAIDKEEDLVHPNPNPNPIKMMRCMRW